MVLQYKRKDSDVIISAIQVQKYNQKNISDFLGDKFVAFGKKDSPRITGG